MRRLAWVLLLALGACQRGGAREPDSVVASSAGVPNVTVVWLPSLLTCGDREASLSYSGDTAFAIVDGRRWVLLRTPDSAGRYAAESDSGPVVWRRDNVTTINLNGLALPQCAELSPLPFVARGHEPGWILRIVDSTMTYIGNYGSDTVTAQVASLSTNGNVTTYETAPPNKLTATVKAEACADGATGMPHPYTVTVTHDTSTVHGCGGEPSTLLRGETWTVTEIASVPTSGTRPTMTFMIAGNAAGTTSCNRYSAPYRLSGEGLKFGAAISTKMACPQPTMDQEIRFLQMLARVARFEITADGALRLLTDEGQAIVARRL
jgi:heat shock protein HslJ